MSVPGDKHVVEKLRRMFLADLGMGAPSSEADGLSIGQIALGRGLITPEQLAEATEERRQRPSKKIGEILLQRGALKPHDFIEILKSQKHLRADPELPALGRYLLLDEIGRGAAGRVYRAIHRELGKAVAIKVLEERPGLPRGLIERFRREAVTVARLQHPNIVAVHDVGEEEGRHFIAMEFVEGGTLKDWLARRPTTADRLLMLEKIARAVHYAHEHQVLHRDLKPENVLVRANGEPVLVDFGLARALDQATLTHEGTAIGTPAYMAPEQVRGERDTIDARADVYALGAILYEMFTGTIPFSGRSVADVYDRILRSEAPAPSVVRPGTPREVDVICGRCLEKNPSDRYASAQALADDLRRLAMGDPIVATRLAFVRRAWRTARRHALLVAACAALLVAACAAAVVTARRVAAGNRALRTADVYVRLAGQFHGVAEDIDEANCAAHRGRSSDEIARDVAAQMAAVADDTGTRDAFHGWLLYRLRSPEGDARLEAACAAHPENPLTFFYRARRRLHECAERMVFPIPMTAAYPSRMFNEDVAPSFPAEARELLESALRDLDRAGASPVLQHMPSLAGLRDVCRGYAAFARGDVEEAQRLLEAHVRHEDWGNEATLLCAVAAILRGDLDRALALAEDLLKRRPHLKPAKRIEQNCLWIKAMALLGARDPACVRAAERALRGNPGAASELLVAQALLSQTRPAEALSHLRRAREKYDEALRASPDDVPSLFNRAIALHLLAEFGGDADLVAAAVRDVSAAIALQPRAQFRVLRATLRLREVELKTSSPAVDEMLAEVRGDLEAVERTDGIPVEREQLRAVYHRTLGQLDERTGRSPVENYRRGLESARAVLAREPAMPLARYQAVWCGASIARLEGAGLAEWREWVRESLAVAEALRVPLLLMRVGDGVDAAARHAGGADRAELEVLWVRLEAARARGFAREGDRERARKVLAGLPAQFASNAAALAELKAARAEVGEK